MEDPLPLLGWEMEMQREKRIFVHRWWGPYDPDEITGCRACRERMNRTRTAKSRWHKIVNAAIERFNKAASSMLQAANKTQDMLNDTPVDKPYVMPRLKTVLLLEEDITVQLIRREKAKLRAKKNLVAACQRHADAFWKMHMCSWKRQRKLFYAYGPAW